MIICGIDSGKCGALAFYDPTTNRIVDIVDMPTLNVSKVKGKTKTVISWSALAERIRDINVSFVYLELVSGGMFGSGNNVGKNKMRMGATSAFSFGRGFGGLEALCAAFRWPLNYATPARWKREFGLGSDKEASRVKASLLLPADTALWTPKRGEVTKLQAEGRAEAALIAIYGARQQQHNKPKRIRL